MLMSCKLRACERGLETDNARGYHVTMLKDCTAGFSIEQKKVATDLIWPLFANEVKTVGEWKKSLDEKS